jgi:hypothetical protein
MSLSSSPFSQQPGLMLLSTQISKTPLPVAETDEGIKALNALSLLEDLGETQGSLVTNSSHVAT